MSAQRVLVVEDDPDIALLSERLLADAGLDVRVAGSVERALRACSEAEPDLALVDLQLPDRSGWDFVREVRASGRYPGMRIAIYTVHFDEPEHVQTASELGVDDFLGKVIDPDDLVARVRRLLAAG